MPWKLSLLTLTIAGATTAYNIHKSTSSWGPSYLAAMLLITIAIILLGCPYAILGILATFIRSRRSLSWKLFAVILAFSYLSLMFLTYETQTYLDRNQALPQGTDLGLFFLGIIQWMLAIMVSSITLLSYLLPPSRSSQNPSRQEIPAS
jgi:hypothetical protein